MAEHFTGKMIVQDVKLKRLQTGDRLQVVLEKAYDIEEHKELIDHISTLNDVQLVNSEAVQPELGSED